MSKKHVSWLVGAILIVAALLLLVPGKTGKESGFEPVSLVPGLAGRVNDIARVRVVRAGNQPVATLARGDSGWTVEEVHSYPADWSRIKALLASLAQAEVAEQKTSNPEYFGRMGVADIAQEQSSALLVELGEGADQVRLLIGNGAQGREGQYVRFADGDQVLLIDRALSVPAQTSEWIDRSIIDLPEAEVVELDLVHPDGETLSIRKVSAGETDFRLLHIPKGREIESSFSVNALGGSLAALRLDEVKPESEVDWSTAVHVRALTADGLEIDADFAGDETGGWLRLKASAYEPATAAREKNESKLHDTAAATEDSAAAVDAEATAALGQRVEGINERVEGWAYRIAEYKADLLTKRNDDLLKATEEK